MVNIKIFYKANSIGMLGVSLSALALLCLSPVVKFYLGASGLGVYYLLTQIFNCLNLSDFGFSNGITREISIENAKGNHIGVQEVIQTGKVILIIVGLFFSISGIAISFIIPKYIQMPEYIVKDFQLALSVLSIWGAFRFVLFLPILHMRSINKIIRCNIYENAQSIGRPLLAGLALFVSPTMISVAIGYILSELIVRIMGSMDLQHHFSFRTYNYDLFLKIVSFGGRTGFISISTLIIFYFTSIVIGWKLGVEEVAIYQSTIALPLLLSRFAIVPFTNLLPKLIEYYAKECMIDLIIVSKRENYRILFFTSIVLIIISMINGIFVGIWVGPELFGGQHFTVVYCIFILMTIARHNGYMVLQSLGRIRILSFFHLVEMPLTIGLVLILLDFYGTVGIPYAFVISTLPVTIFAQLFNFQKRQDSHKVA